MKDAPTIYFVRVNGKTAHNNPDYPELYMPGEPPPYPQTIIRYTKYCLTNNVIRIGWPGSGDLKTADIGSKLKRDYGMENKRLVCVQRYLEAFRDMPIGSVVLMPDKKRPGILYIGEITGPYKYFHDIKRGHWYECAHRHKARWDLNRKGTPREYHAHECGLTIIGGFWRWAFVQIDALSNGAELVHGIEKARRKKS